MRSNRIKTAAVIGVLALVAAACGDDDNEGGAEEDQGVVATAAPSLSAATTATGDTGTTTATEETTVEATGTATATSGAAGEPGTVTADNPSAFGTSGMTGEGPYGQDPGDENIYRGSGDLEIDLSECPDDYDPVQGITDDEIRLGTSLPQSGPLAGFGLLADGLQSYFRYVNEELGGIGGRQIVVDTKDDAYEPNRTKSNVDEMVQSGNYAALVMVLGTPNNLAVWDDLNDECMPQLLNGTGAPQWGDVENHPWTTGMQLDYANEGGLWAEWVQSEFPDGASVAMITFNSDFGHSLSNGFKNAIEGTNIEIVAEELHEPTAPNLTNQFTTLEASGADVLLLATTGAFCTQAMAEAETRAWDPKVMMSAACASLSQFFQPLIDQGLTGDGTYILQAFKDPNDAAFADDPFVQFYHETLTGQGLDSSQTTYFTGWIFGWYMSEILNLADGLPGGLTRPNILIANRSIDTRYPGLLEGIVNRMEGFDDAYLNEAARVVQYEVSDPTQLGTYVAKTDIFNNEGVLGNYSNVEN